MEGRYTQRQHSPAIGGHLESSSPEIAQAAFLWEQNSIRKGPKALPGCSSSPESDSTPLGCQRPPESSNHPCLGEQQSDPSSVQCPECNAQCPECNAQCPVPSSYRCPGTGRAPRAPPALVHQLWAYPVTACNKHSHSLVTAGLSQHL